MSTQINQIIEVRVDGRWMYVPVAREVTDRTDCLCKCGGVRDLFAYKWHGAEDMMNLGVPEDISKKAREAMIYGDEDFINSGTCWITWTQYEALAENLHQKMLVQIEKLVSARMETKITEKLDRIEKMLLSTTQTLPDAPASKEPVEDAEEDHSEEYIQDELDDLKWIWVAAERNMAEIEALVSHFTNDDYRTSDIRVIMYVS